jgi:hypothetical protein
MRRRISSIGIVDELDTEYLPLTTAAGSIEPMPKPDHKAKKQGRPTQRRLVQRKSFSGHDRRTCRTMWLDEAVSGAEA